MTYSKCPVCKTGKLVPGFTSGPACDRGVECKEPPVDHRRYYGDYYSYSPSGDLWFDEDTEVQNP